MVFSQKRYPEVALLKISVEINLGEKTIFYNIGKNVDKIEKNAKNSPLFSIK